MYIRNVKKLTYEWKMFSSLGTLAAFKTETFDSLRRLRLILFILQFSHFCSLKQRAHKGEKNPSFIKGKMFGEKKSKRQVRRGG